MGSRRVFAGRGLKDPRPGYLRGGWLAGLAIGGALVAGVAGCTASSDEVRPPNDQFFFPTGLVLDGPQATLFVASANSELRYDSGVISAINLDTVDTMADGWVDTGMVPSGCTQDPEQPETLVCDEAQFIRGAVRIGNFVTALSLQDRGAGAARLIAPVRGDPSITWVDWTGNAFACEDGSNNSFSLCDDRHRLTSVNNDDDRPITEEPFRAFVDSGNEFSLVSHLTSGVVTLLDLKAETPIVTDVSSNLFQPLSALLPGSSGIAGRNPGVVRMPAMPNLNTDDLIYVGSHTDDRVQLLTVERADGTPYLVQSSYFLLNAVGGNNGRSEDTRSLSFTEDGDRMLLINRRPPSLQIYDTSLDETTGQPRNQAVTVYDICREASGLAVGKVGADELALVSCFREGTVFILDADGRRPTDAVVTVGRGPYDVVMSPSRKKAYVTNFLEDTVGVIELDPASKRQYREVLRIGEKRL